MALSSAPSWADSTELHAPALPAPPRATALVPAARVQECLAFALGPDEYGIDIRHVQELRAFEAPTELPGVPTHIQGFLNLRGHILPLVDLRLHYGLVDGAGEASAVVVILRLGVRMAAVVVDSVADVVELPQAERPLILIEIDAAWWADMGLVGTPAH